jgi:hypothetical protein
LLDSASVVKEPWTYRGTADRQHNLVLRVSDEELAKLKVLAEDGDEPMAGVVRR